MRTTVVVPTYRRPDELARCLAAIRAQSLLPDEILVVVRAGDSESDHVVADLSLRWPELRAVSVQTEGVVSAMNAALDVATGDILALTDDDAEPAGDWLERIVGVLSEPNVGAVGGRDIQSAHSGHRADVGRLQWFGRVIGNHHLGAGAARDVDVVKGACSGFRMDALCPIRFDERLRGRGAQVHWELSLCLALQRAGWRVIYDPQIQVVHRVAVRHDADQRDRFNAASHEDAVYNETLVLREHLQGLRRSAFTLWATLVGTRESPGVLQLPRVMVREGRNGWTRFLATQRARRAAMH